MKWLPAILSLMLLLALTFVLNSKLGSIPPLGKFLSPFTGFWQQAEGRNQSGEGKLEVAGIKNNITVLYDKNRVPHIFAGTDYDLYFAQGYVTARDRLWQMEFQTHAAAGRISEIVGAQGIDFDRFQRRMGMVTGAEQSLAGMQEDPATRLMLEAYTAGINAYIDQLTPKTYPLEYKLLDYAPEPWTPLKCALITKIMSYDLAGRSDDLRMTNILNRFGPEVVQDLFPDYPFREDPIVPVGTKFDFRPVNVPERPASFIGAVTDKVPQNEPPAELGSNNWAVAGTKSVTGYPLLANDPHLQLNLPSIWYQVQMVGPGVNVYGASIPGAPGVVIGFNKEVSWGVTNVHADVMDWYQIKFKDGNKTKYWHNNQWKPVRRVIEKIKVRGGDTNLDTVFYTHHGPVVYDKPGKVFNKQTPVSHALRWIAHEKSNELRTLYLLNRARNYQDFQNALQYWVAPAQNFVYADVHQDISLWPNGRFPLKWKNQGKFILDGTDGVNDWQGWIPAAQNPHVTNPDRGFVSSANQSSTGPDYPYYINWEFSPSDRALRINQRLAGMQRVTPDSMRRLQNDNFNMNAQIILPALLSQLDKNKLNKTQQMAFQELSDWGYYNHPDQISPTVFELWWQTLSKAIWDDEFGSQENLEMRYPTRDRTWHLILQEPQAPWYDNKNTPAKETLPFLARQTFKFTIDSLEEQHGAMGKKWQWGNHKATSIQHLAKLPGFGRENIFIGGGRGIVNATSERHGPSWRMVVALGPQVKGYGIYPGGQSGNPGSFYYDNLIETWRQGKLHELVYLQAPAEAAGAVISKLSLQKK